MSEAKTEFLRAFDVSRETMERLEIYADLLAAWTKRINLVSPKTLQDLWTRHFADSAQLLSLAPSDVQTWADLGSGGGFPGAVVAIMALESRPDLRVTLVESDMRKATFLRAIARETGSGFDVKSERIEAVAPLASDVISARALAPLPTLLGYVERHLRPGGTALLPKGARMTEEMSSALERWSFTCQTYRSNTDEEAVILKIGEIERV